ncbi:MAG TPA: hypothetical protein VJ327_02095 [Patescibacteria group bacterium]|jgi:hypothetical protein|nr:hypothetical protein [Patescibacteria group bacterium]
MKRANNILTIAITAVGLAVISGVCWHSIEEIHYLKSFFPKQFTVQEAYYASKIELIKIAIICFPILIIIGISLYLLHYFRKDL